MPDPGFERRSSDHGASIVDGGAFEMILGLEVKKAQRLRYFVSIVCLRLQDSDATLERVARGIAANIRETDCISLRDDRSVLMLLIDAEPHDLAAIVDRVIASVDTRVWSAGGASYPNSALAGSELLSQAIELQARAEKHGGERFYVANGA